MAQLGFNLLFVLATMLLGQAAGVGGTHAWLMEDLFLYRLLALPPLQLASKPSSPPWARTAVKAALAVASLAAYLFAAAGPLGSCPCLQWDPNHVWEFHPRLPALRG